MIKSITNFLIIFFIFQWLKSEISQIDQNGVTPFCDETLQIQLRDRNIITVCDNYGVKVEPWKLHFKRMVKRFKRVKMRIFTLLKTGH